MNPIRDAQTPGERAQILRLRPIAGQQQVIAARIVLPIRPVQQAQGVDGVEDALLPDHAPGEEQEKIVLAAGGRAGREGLRRAGRVAIRVHRRPRDVDPLRGRAL